MALRHPFPNFVLDVARVGPEPTEVVPKALPPVQVSLVTLDDVTALEQALRSSRRVEVAAGTGFGKSTVLPGLIKRITGLPVVYTVPPDKLAWAQQDYAGECAGVSVWFCEEANSPLPQADVYFMSTSMYCVRRVAVGGALPESFILFMDESHESDGSTSALRDGCLREESVRALVLASATATPVGHLPSVLRERITVQTYPECSPETWSAIHDVDSPWHHTRMTENTLVFVERPEVVARLSAEYRDYGIGVISLTAKTPLAEFKRIYRRLASGMGGVHVIFLDYSYRSGYTLFATRMIDSGEVSYAVPLEGGCRREYRRTYEGEQEQAVARICRLPGQTGEAWVPAGAREWKVCNLEAVECDAAALLLRYMGYKPPKTYDTPMRAGLVPKVLSNALNGFTPLRCIPQRSMTVWPGGTGVSDFSRVIAGLTPPPEVEVPAAKGLGSPFQTRCPSPVTPSDGFVTPPFRGLASGSPEAVAEAVVQLPRADVVARGEIDEEMRSLLCPGEFVLEMGKYYYVPGLEVDAAPTIAFPEGPASVLRMAQRPDFASVAAGLGEHDRMYAVRVLLDEYNGHVLRVVGVRRLAAQLPAMKQQILTPATVPAFREWFTDLVETLTVNGALANQMMRVLLVLRPAGYEVMDMGAEAEKAIISSYVASLHDALGGAVARDLDAVRRRMVERAKVVPKFRDKRLFVCEDGSMPYHGSSKPLACGTVTYTYQRRVTTEESSARVKELVASVVGRVQAALGA